MRNKELHNWRKKDLIDELEKRNFQYGELSNKYATLKYKLEINSQMQHPKTNDDSIGVGVKANKQEDTLHGLFPFEGKVIQMNKDSVQDNPAPYSDGSSEKVCMCTFNSSYEKMYTCQRCKDSVPDKSEQLDSVCFHCGFKKNGLECDCDNPEPKIKKELHKDNPAPYSDGSSEKVCMCTFNSSYEKMYTCQRCKDSVPDKNELLSHKVEDKGETSTLQNTSEEFDPEPEIKHELHKDYALSQESAPKGDEDVRD